MLSNVTINCKETKNVMNEVLNCQYCNHLGKIPKLSRICFLRAYISKNWRGKNTKNPIFQTLAHFHHEGLH